jgi:hypothetical protein
MRLQVVGNVLRYVKQGYKTLNAIAVGHLSYMMMDDDDENVQ